MAAVQPGNRDGGEDTVELVGEASSSGSDRSSSSGAPPSIAVEPPSLLTWMWSHIVTACWGFWIGSGGDLSWPSRAKQLQEESESEVSSRIAASQSTWSEVPGGHSHHSGSTSRSSQLPVWEELKQRNPRFFRDYSCAELELGRLIAEGGQAEIFKAKCEGHEIVLKVFKLDAGFSLEDFKCHWPSSMRKNEEGSTESMLMQERCTRFIFEDLYYTIFGHQCVIVGATLLENGRFAFLMERYWGDLRTLLDLKVEESTHSWEFNLFKNSGEQSPFSLQDSMWIILQIAMGMRALHKEGVLHRDLKAANVLMSHWEFSKLHCDVADYECAMFVQGTGFWRAPEILQELQKKEEDRNCEIWTEKVDVYSFGMTCYEVLTGRIPFDGCTKSKWDDVIKGERPFLPDFIHLELQELVEACWHAQPSQRPSLKFILEELRILNARYGYSDFQ